MNFLPKHQCASSSSFFWGSLGFLAAGNGAAASEMSLSPEICSVEQPPDTCVGKAALARGCITSWFCFAPEKLEITFSVHCAGLQGMLGT